MSVGAFSNSTLSIDYFKLTAGSGLAINKALKLAEVVTDFFGNARGTSPDIGAMEYIASTSVSYQHLPVSEANDRAQPLWVASVTSRGFVTIVYRLPVSAVGNTSLGIYDLHGKRMYEFGNIDKNDGKGCAVWYGNTIGGRSVGSGPYIVRLRTERGDFEKKIFLTR
jgi:hypothetical protein